MKKICFVTSTRAEYGSLKWLMKDVKKSRYKLQIIATGAHLMSEQGHTVDEIISDGFIVDESIDAMIITDTEWQIAESMGRLGQMIAQAYNRLSPDAIVVLGDRYELLTICSTAFIMRIPIIHISGGDVTSGIIDDGVRNAITMLADYHFPSVLSSKENIIRMRGKDSNVWHVGALELDALTREELMTRAELADNLNLSIDRKWGLVTFHAETKQSLNYNLTVVNNLVECVLSLDEYQVVATYSNADFGGKYINEFLEKAQENNKDKLRVISSLGHRRYLSFLKQVSFMAGNSSSGITQSPMLGVPCVNIGNRQQGRHQCENVLQCGVEMDDMKRCVYKAVNSKKRKKSDYWGDGHASEKIMKILNQIFKD